MFGKNPIEKRVDDDGKQLRVVDGKPFYTIQGEGIFGGHPATFIRLWGCNLRCWFCDTDFSNPNDPMVPIETLLEECLKYPARLVVITGGEPLRQNCAPLIGLLLAHGFTVQLETAGTLWRKELEAFDGHPGLHFIVSPKTGRVVQELMHRAAAYKYIINEGDYDESDGLPIMSTQKQGEPNKLARPPLGKLVYLSPCDVYDADGNKRNHALVARLAMKHNYIAQVQLHKVLDLP